MKSIKWNGYFFSVIAIMLCGAGFAYYVSIACGPSSNWRYHLAQWLPLFFGAMFYAYIGFDTEAKYTYWGGDRTRQEFHIHSKFWIFGRIGAALVSAGVGYILGREMFF